MQSKVEPGQPHDHCVDQQRCPEAETGSHAGQQTLSHQPPAVAPNAQPQAPDSNQRLQAKRYLRHGEACCLHLRHGLRFAPAATFRGCIVHGLKTSLDRVHARGSQRQCSAVAHIALTGARSCPRKRPIAGSRHTERSRGQVRSVGWFALVHLSIDRRQDTLCAIVLSKFASPVADVELVAHSAVQQQAELRAANAQPFTARPYLCQAIGAYQQLGYHEAGAVRRLLFFAQRPLRVPILPGAVQRLLRTAVERRVAVEPARDLGGQLVMADGIDGRLVRVCPPFHNTLKTQRVQSRLYVLNLYTDRVRD